MYKPFYKQFLKIRQNVQNRKKIFKFNKNKWKKLQLYSKKQLKFYKRFKLKDPFKFKINKFTSKGNSFQKRYKKNLIENKKFNIFYGGLKKTYLTKKVNNIKKSKKYRISKFFKTKYQILKFFENRLDIILYRAKFTLSIKNARQLIKHKHVLVNNSIIKTPSYILKTNDLIEITPNIRARTLIKKYINQSNFWPLPPKYLVINYTSLQIIFLYDKNYNFLPNFTYQLNFILQ